MTNGEKYKTAKEREKAYKEYLNRTKNNARRAGKFEWLSLEEESEQLDWVTLQFYEMVSLFAKIKILCNLGVFNLGEQQFLYKVIKSEREKRKNELLEEMPKEEAE